METSEWYEDIFNKYYILFNGHGDTRAEISGIEKVLRINPTMKILDLCCGYGRHAIELAKRGYQVTAIDLSEVLLRKAKEDAEREAVKVNFMKSDMREIPFKNEFDTVINVFTSFGYFEKDSENRKVLRAVFETLKPQGKFLLDQNNKFSPEKPEGVTTEIEIKESIKFTKKAMFNKNSGLYQGTYKYEFNKMGDNKEYPFFIKIYNKTQLENLFKSAGFSQLKFFGDFQGNELRENSPRIIVIGTKSLN